jgi:hypothetical protein
MKSKLDKIIQENEPRHWSTRVDDIRSKQKAAEIDRVSCSCDTCMFWSAGDKCVAESISLSKKPDVDYGAVVICETFVAAG